METQTYVMHQSDFVKLRLNDDGRSALVLGYRVELTAAEYEILRILSSSEAAIHKSDICRQVEIKENGLAVHIANINKKARPITGRRLIEGNRKAEYRISETM